MSPHVISLQPYCKLFFVWMILLLSSSPTLFNHTVVEARAVAEPQHYDREERVTNKATLEPRLRHGRMPAFHGKEIRDCLPKGFRHASAPSRYVNYRIFGALNCSPRHRHHFQKP
ncbi:hypothetical protein DM860_006223 [Cuscuta australis]|uniref:Uncharacterized protein n=1 Tax=Cuscuta australis TaxID=267555 RepID=A0A328DP21_9ASTE|nr:hypothetical protein DM860_006223 [Cuscuta australis]